MVELESLKGGFFFFGWKGGSRSQSRQRRRKEWAMPAHRRCLFDPTFWKHRLVVVTESDNSGEGSYRENRSLISKEQFASELLGLCEEFPRWNDEIRSEVRVGGSPSMARQCEMQVLENWARQQ